MVDGHGEDGDDGRVKAAPLGERLLSAVCVAGVIVGMWLAVQVSAPEGGDDWTDGAAGTWLWLFVGLVPVVLAGLATAGRRGTRGGGLLPLGMAVTVVLATVVGESLH